MGGGGNNGSSEVDIRFASEGASGMMVEFEDVFVEVGSVESDIAESFVCRVGM